MTVGRFREFAMRWWGIWVDAFLITTVPVSTESHGSIRRQRGDYWC